MTLYTVTNTEVTRAIIKELDGEIKETHNTFLHFACIFDWEYVRDKFGDDIVGTVCTPFISSPIC